ncbi:MAG: hypothetical protein EA409_04350 [Saprospirales bacterium]|nr:MAG: hypothetical protein EA409_04350 [Saprospirales bacterium]
MRRKYKLTGCARFLIFLVVAVPVIFFTAQFITGENPLNELKNAIGWGSEEVEWVENSGATVDTSDQIKTQPPLSNKEEEITPISEPQKTDLSQYHNLIQDLKQQISELEKRIEKLEMVIEERE